LSFLAEAICTAVTKLQTLQSVPTRCVSVHVADGCIPVPTAQSLRPQ